MILFERSCFRTRRDNVGGSERISRKHLFQRKKGPRDCADLLELGQWCPEEDSNLHAREGAST